MKKAYLGMDLGGSNLYSVAFTEDLKPIFEEKLNTEAREGYTHVIGRISGQIESFKQRLAAEDYELDCIGLGVPGVVHSSEGYVSEAPNLDWEDCRPIADLTIDPALREKTYLINDVNAGLLGELQYLGRKPSVAIAYFCGTGVGGAVAIHGAIHSGADGSAGEVGHMVIRKNGRTCGCGRSGCLEAYIGKWALNRKIAKAIEKGKKTRLADVIQYDLGKTPVKSSSLKKAYEKGDAFTVDLMDRYYASNLGIGISQSCNLLAPDLVVLGGGIIEALGKQLLPYIEAVVAQACMGRVPEIVIGSGGDYAGPAGAVLFARSQ